MPIFDYRAITSNGIKSRGLINAFNERAAKEILAERGLVIKSLKEKTDSLYLKVLTFINPIKAKDLVIFSREFSVMISANLAMVQALKISAEQTDNISLKMLIYEIAYEVDSGSALSSALAKRPKIFTQFFTNVVRSGESSGRLDEVLIYLADEIEKDYNMNGKIIGAMIYPIFVLIGMIGVGIIMMVKVVPSLTGIIDESNAALPWSTRVVLGVSNFLIHDWILIVTVVLTLIIVSFTVMRTEKAKRAIDLLKFKLPVFGRLFQLIYIVRFTRSLNTLIIGGVSIGKSLEVVSGVVDNYIFKDLILQSKKEVEEGESISKPFMNSDIIPKMLPQMIVVGEKTGKLDMVLSKVTNFYDQEVNNMLNNLVTLLEPLIIIVMGVGVAIMVAAILMPMYNLAGQM